MTDHPLKNKDHLARLPEQETKKRQVGMTPGGFRAHGLSGAASKKTLPGSTDPGNGVWTAELAALAYALSVPTVPFAREMLQIAAHAYYQQGQGEACLFAELVLAHPLLTDRDVRAYMKVILKAGKASGISTAVGRQNGAARVWTHLHFPSPDVAKDYDAFVSGIETDLSYEDKAVGAAYLIVHVAAVVHDALWLTSRSERKAALTVASILAGAAQEHVIAHELRVLARAIPVLLEEADLAKASSVLPSITRERILHELEAPLTPPSLFGADVGAKRNDLPSLAQANDPFSLFPSSTLHPIGAPPCPRPAFASSCPVSPPSFSCSWSSGPCPAQSPSLRPLLFPAESGGAPSCASRPSRASCTPTSTSV